MVLRPIQRRISAPRSRMRMPIYHALIFSLLLLAAACTIAVTDESRRNGPSSAALSITPTPTIEPEPTVTPTTEPADPTPTPEPETAPDATPEPTPDPEPTPAPESDPDPSLDLGSPPYIVPCADRTFDDPVLAYIVRQSLGDHASGFSIVVQELHTGARAELNPDQSYYGASLFKSAIMYTVMQAVDAGEISFDQTLLIDESDASWDLGTLSSLGWGPGTQITVAQALHASITISDNASANMLGDLVGWHTANQALTEIGATDTDFSDGELPTTARDMAALMQAIACGTNLSETSAQYMLDVHAEQQVRNRIPAQLPGDVVVANKTGNWPNATHGMGIVYGEDRVWVIAALSSWGGGETVIAQLSRDIYDYLEGDSVPVAENTD